MASDEPPSILQRLELLERQVKALRARLEIVEKNIGPRVENPRDRTAVREKAVFDWQS